MIRHLLTLMWNRKRRNALLCIEILFSFAVVAVLAVFALNYVNNWRLGIGYRIDDVWVVVMGPSGRTGIGQLPETSGQVVRDLMATARSVPAVQAVTALNITPYSFSDWSGDTHLTDGRTLYVFMNAATDETPDVLGLDLTEGRWFRNDDASDRARPVVINQRLARDIFGESPAAGQIIPENPPDREDDPRSVWKPRRVIGVVREFRKDGEFSTPQHYMFTRFDLDRPNAGPFPTALLVRVAPGTPAAAEETLLNALRGVARDWSFQVHPLAQDRQTITRFYLSVLLVPAVIAAFVLLMVALGLIGVLWQNVTARTREFGLRRANGASAETIRRQVLLELLILASFALVPGALLGFQLTALPIPDYVVPGRIIIAGVAVSVVVIYLVVLVCGWYPSRMATAIRPAEALHYE